MKHEWNLETAYYSATLPIWVDELSDVEAWKAEFLKPEAEEVVQAIGAWIFCFQQQLDGQIASDAEMAMQSVQEVMRQHGADAPGLAVAIPTGNKSSGDSDQAEGKEEQEDTCWEYGFEYIVHGATGHNEYGEKVGLERLREVLEVNEWQIGSSSGMDIDDPEALENFDFDDFLTRSDAFDPGLEFGDEVSEQQALQVENMNGMLEKLLAVKESSAELPEAQRRRMAADAVRDLMKKESSA